MRQYQRPTIRRGAVSLAGAAVALALAPAVPAQSQADGSPQDPPRQYDGQPDAAGQAGGKYGEQDDGSNSYPGGTPYAMDDRSWIEIGGTVESVTRDSFELDYGDGVITVEMDDGDRDADGYQLLRGDEVSVSGMIDDDFFTATSIEASSVYVEDIGATFYSSAIDDEDAAALALNDVSPVDVSAMVVRGFVTDVNTTSFVLDTGPRTLEINVAELGYDPLDDDGYQRIEVGDHVKASGEISRDLFSGRELVADSVTELFLDMEQPAAATPGS